MHHVHGDHREHLEHHQVLQLNMLQILDLAEKNSAGTKHASLFPPKNLQLLDIANEDNERDGTSRKTHR